MGTTADGCIVVDNLFGVTFVFILLPPAQNLCCCICLFLFKYKIRFSEQKIIEYFVFYCTVHLFIDYLHTFACMLASVVDG